MRSSHLHTTLLFVVTAAALATAQQKPDAAAVSLTSIATKIVGLKHMSGLLPLDWDNKTGKLYLEIPGVDASGRSADLLWTNSLPFGTGSNDLGLDRGQTSSARIVHFERTGPKLLLIQSNQRFRSSSTDPAQLLTVRQSFPESVLWGFRVEAEDTSGAILVDATEFFLSDVHLVAESLSRTHQGSYKVDPSRSTIAIDNTRAFPKNTDVEATLTFAADGSMRGEFVRDVAPDPRALTVREHQTFLELPPPGFSPRRFSPRAGYFPSTYRDYAAPLGEPLDQQFILRHRLLKKLPSCTRACEAQQPIQYYVDSGAPEPIRTALLEGARWWDQAFQAAGWAKGTFRVDILPVGADPMDIRYNMIQWVHRYTRGWSYGAAISDPRTGEIIKGNVTLGSLRGRQDYLIAEALLSPYVAGKKISTQTLPMEQMVLARIRQLAAHETGHTLGLAHNFAASAFAQSASVMDYPHPYIAFDAHGSIDLSHAYAVNIGQWDKVAIDYGYRQGNDDDASLQKLLSASEKTGLIFITDEDARPLGSAHPIAHLWDNGPDAAAELERILELRAVALGKFGENAIRMGSPLAQLEDTLVPLYLLHRYQTEAAIKVIGGLDYRYNLRGDGQPLPAIVRQASQQRALVAVLKTLTPETLTLSEPLLNLLPPLPPGLERTRESFTSRTGLTFDPVAAAESAADLTLAALLDPARASRLVQYHMRQPGSPSLRGVLEAVSDTVAKRGTTQGLASEIGRAVETRAIEAMLTLAVNPMAASQARAIARSHLMGRLSQMIAAPPLADTAEAIHRAALVARIQEFERDPARFTPSKMIEAPPGMPIGEDEVFD